MQIALAGNADTAGSQCGVDPAQGGSSRRKEMNTQVQAEIQGLMKTSSPYLLATRDAHSLHRLLALHRYLLPSTSEQSRILSALC